MADWLTWCKRLPQKDDGQGKGRFMIPHDKKKIVLMTGSTTVPPPNTHASPTHFTITLGSQSQIWQHVRVDRAAYRLSRHNPSGSYEVDSNIHLGDVIQVFIKGPISNDTSYTGTWDKERYKQLAWYLVRLCNGIGVAKEFPFTFTASGSDPNKARKSVEAFVEAKGIVGWEHVPFNTNQASPGIFSIGLLRQYMNDDSVTGGVAPPGSQKNVYDNLEENEAVYPSDPGSTDADEPETELLEDIDISTKPFRFNPPLHRLAVPKRVEFASTGGDWKTHLDGQYLDERALAADPIGAEALKGLRLGRLIQHEKAAGMAAVGPHRYGMRFLFNPTSVTVSASRNKSFVIDARSTINSVVSGINQNFQIIRFTLFLVRSPDVLGPAVASDYIPGISDEDLEGVKQYGTHWDLEILYRACNGVFDLEDRGKTGDIGIVVPSNMRLLLGNQNWFGFVESVDYEHKIFNRGMVPMLTDVDIVFRRHVDMEPTDLAQFEQDLGIITSGGFPAGGAAASPGGAASTPVGNSNDAPVPAAYGWNNPFGKPNSIYSSGYHTGEDYSAAYGAAILATRSGTVKNTGYGIEGSPYGYTVTILCEGDITCLYAHMQDIEVSKGQTVVAGQRIGTVGSSGTKSSGPHLHYEERNHPGKYANVRLPIWSNWKGDQWVQ